MEVNLSSTISSTLFSTQRIAALAARTQERIATGQQHHSLIDNPQAVTVANSLSNRASDLLAVKNNISQGISKVETADLGLGYIQEILNQLKAVSLAHNSTDSVSDQAVLNNQFDVLKEQLNGLVRDTSYGGTNLIDALPDNLTVNFNEDGSSAVTVEGQASDAATLGVLITDVGTIDAALSEVRSSAETLGSDASILAIREEFTDKLVNSLEEGEAKLLETDLNEQAANALSLETRTQLSVAATKVTAQSERAILQLF